MDQTPDGAAPDASGLAAALGAIPSGLFVVTTGTGDEATGFLASFVQQVGFEPPAVTVAVRSETITELLRSTGAFCINVLADGDRVHLARFAKGPPPAGEAFADLDVVAAPRTGVPALSGSLAQLECRLLGEVAEWTDHVVFCGEAVGGRRTSDDDRSAVHLRRNGLSY